MRGQDDDWYVRAARLLPQGLQKSKATHHRHDEVEQHDLWHPPFDLHQRRLPVGHLADPPPVGLISLGTHERRIRQSL